MKLLPVWKPPASVKYFTPGVSDSAYVPWATQMIAPLVAAAIAAASVLYGWAAVPFAAPVLAASTNTVHAGIVVVRATFTARGAAAGGGPGGGGSTVPEVPEEPDDPDVPEELDDPPESSLLPHATTTTNGNSSAKYFKATAKR